jgi:glycosyltransferase involved in cell wall biosynthesis
MNDNLSKSKILSETHKLYPKVTIITAVYNADKYIRDCILNVLSQSYKNFDYIIIDGGSTDNTVNIIREYAEALTYWVSEPDKGIYDAWNKGVKIAKGDWIAFIGADDLLLPEALQNYIDHISQHPRQHELEFVSSQIELVKDDLSPIRTVGTPWSWNLFKNDMVTWHVGSFHSKQLFNKYGLFDTSYKVCGDYELLLRPKENLITSYVPKLTVKMRVGGVSSVRLYQAIEETYNAKMNNGLLSPTQAHLKIVIDKARVMVRRLLGRDQFKS